MKASIRTLKPTADRVLVAEMMRGSADYFRLWLGRPASGADVDDFFTGAPPGVDPATARHFGLFLRGELSGIASLTFGFPEPGDPYLGLIILSPGARGMGHGVALLSHVEDAARSTGAKTLYLAVLDANPRGRAFWTREGFAPTGVSRTDDSHGQNHTVYRLAKPL